MKLDFIGTNAKISEDEFADMVVFFGGLLLTERQLSKLNLTISFDPTEAIPRWSGYTHQQDDRYSYLIWIRPTKSIHQQIETLAHEMVHVKQFLRKEVCVVTGKILDPTLRLWSKKSSNYYDNPSEIEAFGRTFGMVNRYYEQKMLTSTH